MSAPNLDIIGKLNAPTPSHLMYHRELLKENFNGENVGKCHV